MRAVTARLLVALFALLPIQLVAGTTDHGIVNGYVTLNGQPASQAEIVLVELKSGAIQRLKSGEGGRLEATVPAGDYVATTHSHGGVSISQAPTHISVQAGRVVPLRVELVAPLVAFPAPPAGHTAKLATNSSVATTGEALLPPSSVAGDAAAVDSAAAWKAQTAADDGSDFLGILGDAGKNRCCRFKRFGRHCGKRCSRCCRPYPRCCKVSKDDDDDDDH